MRIKTITAILLALVCTGCAKKSEKQMNLGEKLVLLHQYIEDSTLVFDDYEPFFVEILDSLEDIVYNSKDAEDRFIARQIPTRILASICMHNSENTRDSIWHQYDRRREEILTTWYVQQLIDSTDNSPYVIMSYAAPFDEDINVTRIGFTFSENNNPQSEPVMIITLPDVTDYVIILFSLWDETNITKYTEYYSSKGEMSIASDSTRTSILLFGKFLQDMLKYEEMKVCYYNRHINTEECGFEPLVPGFSRIPVDLHQFQRQYQIAHQWVLECQ